MNSRRFMFLIAITSTVLALTLELGAQHTRYTLIDTGTLGGPASYQSVNAPGYKILTNSGTLSTSADTPNIAPPELCENPGCFVTHATRWHKGVLTDLGALSGADNSSAAGAINERGWSAGQGQNGVIDPISGFEEGRAVLWTRDQIIDLGAFGGFGSLATTLNNAGQVVGFSTNTIPDPLPMFIGGTQTRAFLWEKGILQDLGTLGGPDAQALYINNSGEVAGVSYTDPNETPNATTGIPTIHPFIWKHGRMTDLGTLGGTFTGPFGIDNSEGSFVLNDHGLLIGISTLDGDQTYHPFLWDGKKLRDLGTLGGNNGTALWLTESGEVVGQADLPGSAVHDAFLWRNGFMTDLGNLGGNSVAFWMNSRGQIVGRSKLVQTSQIRHAFIWENGGPMVDLNTLIPPGSGLLLYEADNINERGEIAGVGLPDGCNNPDSCGHLFLLIPCDGNDALVCESPGANAAATPPLNSVPVPNRASSSRQNSAGRDPLAGLRPRLAQRFHLVGSSGPRD